MHFSLCKTIRTTRAVPEWVLSRIKTLAELSHLLPIEEVAQPVWKLPAGVRTAAVVFALIALVTGVRVLDAQISAIGPAMPALRTVESQTPFAPDLGGATPTALLVDSPPAGDTHRFLLVKVSAYTSSHAETDESPDVTARGRLARPGTLALSRDLLRTFTPGAPFDFGDRVLIPGMGIYVVEDTMNPRWTRKADIWFSNRATALRWGVRDVYLTQVDAGDAIIVANDWHS